MLSILEKIESARIEIEDSLPSVAVVERNDAFDRLVQALGKLELYVDQYLEVGAGPDMDPWLDDALEQRVACL
jgi:hypothetical protein